uniref:SAUR family protein 22 n=1 Tax=Morus alba TaxID=3498 RepID=A0A075BRC8_MORAL|nr:SAUR family protein 22 [Morus alba]
MTISASEQDKHHHMIMNFHLQIPHIHLHHHDQKKDHHHHQELKDIPKGCLAVMVGSQGEEPQRFVIPVIYINHPLFMQLLKEAEEEYGFDQKGPITIPCHVEEFRTVQGIIDKENSIHHHHHHHHHHNRCFRVWSLHPE